MIAGIFVGGRARRMAGTAKGLLRLPSGESVIDRLCELLTPVVTKVVLVGAHPAYAGAGVPVIGDTGEALGPLGGLIALLREAGDGPALVVACDMPFVTDALVARLIAAAPGAPAVAPQVDGRWQPFFARYESAAALTLGESHATAGVLSLQALLNALQASPLPLSDDERRLLDDCDDWPTASLKGLRPPAD